MGPESGDGGVRIWEKGHWRNGISRQGRHCSWEMPGGTTVPYKKTKHKTFNAFCTQLAFLVNTKPQTGGSRSGVWIREAQCQAWSSTRAPCWWRGKRKSKGTLIETVPRHALHTAEIRSMYTHARVSTERWGPWMETLLNCKSPPPHNPGSETGTVK